MAQHTNSGFTIIAKPGIIVPANVIETLCSRGHAVCVMDALGTRVLSPDRPFANKRLVVSDGFDFTLHQIQERWQAGRRYFRLKSNLGQISIWPDSDEEFIFVALLDRRDGNNTVWMLLLTIHEAKQLVMGAEADEVVLFHQHIADYFNARDRADLRLFSIEQIEEALPWERIKKLEASRI